MSKFEEIYNYSKSYEEYASSLHESLSYAQQIVDSTKTTIDFPDLLKTTFANRYDSLTIDYSNADSSIQATRKFFLESVKSSIHSLFEMGKKDDYKVNLRISDTCIRIDIILDTETRPINTEHIQRCLEKARLFALLDKGFVGISRLENQLVFTLVYNYTLCPIGDCKSCTLLNNIQKLEK